MRKLNRTRVREMALNKDTPEGAAIRDFVDILRQHQAVLPSLPEILERLISNETSETKNFDMSRYAFDCLCLFTAVLYRFISPQLDRPNCQEI